MPGVPSRQTRAGACPEFSSGSIPGISAFSTEAARTGNGGSLRRRVFSLRGLTSLGEEHPAGHLSREGQPTLRADVLTDRRISQVLHRV